MPEYCDENDLHQAVGRIGLCTLLERAAGYEVPPKSNSIVHFTTLHITADILDASLPVFDWAYARESSVVRAYPHLRRRKFKREDLMFSSNFVQVLGKIDEPLHIHSTTIVAQVVHGKGILRHVNKGKTISSIAKEGDMLVIPVGAPHFFVGDPFISYVGIEFGPVVDYQKHYSS